MFRFLCQNYMQISAYLMNNNISEILYYKNVSNLSCNSQCNQLVKNHDNYWFVFLPFSPAISCLKIDTLSCLTKPKKKERLANADIINSVKMLMR